MFPGISNKKRAHSDNSLMQQAGGINSWWMQWFSCTSFQWSNQLLPISHSFPSNTHGTLPLFLWTTISSVFQQSSCSGRSTIHGENQSDSPSWIEAIILCLITTLLNYNWKHNLTSQSKLVKKAKYQLSTTPPGILNPSKAVL